MPTPLLQVENNINGVPIDSLGLPMLSFPTELYNTLFHPHLHDFQQYNIATNPSTSQAYENQYDYVPFYSLTAHPLSCNPLFYYDIHAQQFLPFEQQAIQPFTISSSTPTTTTQRASYPSPSKACHNCLQQGHRSSLSKKCENYR
jgi:hypothetical protein